MKTPAGKQTATSGSDPPGKNESNNNSNGRRRRRRRKGKRPVHVQVEVQEEQAEQKGQKPPPPPPTSNKSKNKSKKGKNKHKHPWRKLLKKGVVDPISLEPLVKLPYPPFALDITEPYVPIPVWPPPKEIDDETKRINETKRRQQKKIEEQWGSKLSSTAEVSAATTTTTTTATVTKYGQESISETIKSQHSQKIKSSDIDQDGKETKHVHLFDGRVLAYYLVSQLQFIDPLNRRDLTREEIINLDSYLQRHKLKQASVLEAYDSKGITLNSAGISGQTSSGRAAILQQEAQVLLNSLFQINTPARNNITGNNNNSDNNNNNNNRRDRRRRNNRRENNNENQFLTQYAAFQSSDRNEGSNRQRDSQNNGESIHDGTWPTEGGLYTNEGGGMVIIDDNINPGLRGATDLSHAMETLSYPRNGHQTTRRQEDNFPALTTTSTANQEMSTAINSQSDKPAITVDKKVSKSLLKIGKVIEKTNPKDIVKQKKAREEALRKMELANLPYEEYIRRNKTSVLKPDNMENQESERINPVGPIVPTDKQLERNQNLANALGVDPSTVRNKATSFNEGWRRPTNTVVSLDEFGNELNSTEYSDELIIEAKERMTEVLKLEKKWIAWLDDDKAASYSLKKMDKETRIFVHKYSDYWNIQTRSYDPEPRRYIHCVKMLETYAPRPLLSDAVKNWRGPVFKGPRTTTSKETTEDMFSSTAREFPLAEDRTPLKLSSRTIPTGVQPSVLNESNSSGQPQINIYGSEAREPNERFASLMAERERTKLILEPRTKPLELPPYQPSQKKIDEMMQEKRNKMMENDKLKRHQEEEKKKRILEAAFASEDEESSSDSDWEIGEALYSGSEEE